MSARLDVQKTYKLFIAGKFPRTESGRSIRFELASGAVAHLCHASRKDLRDAVEAARAAQPKWADATAYNRGQVLYRMAEMMEGKRQEFADAIGEASSRRNTKASKSRSTSRIRASSARTGSTAGRSGAIREVDAAIDRLVCFAGWADKYAQVLGCNNPVASPHYNFTVPEPTGVVAVVAPPGAAEPPLLSLVSLLAPPLCAGNAVVAIAGDANPVPAAVLGEVCATSDVPAGVVNMLTGKQSELLEHLANHRDIDAIHAANLAKKDAMTLRLGAAENVKRVHVREIEPDHWYEETICESPWMIEAFVEMKTIWHPSAM
ncbi:MAG TPA: aldehyde dehydrogenase family protein [Phycisphaerales bacterium]|nr:aldehyde dehydrogenase family protein [Phycisphaerales bacterium]